MQEKEKLVGREKRKDTGVFRRIYGLQEVRNRRKKEDERGLDVRD